MTQRHVKVHAQENVLLANVNVKNGHLAVQLIKDNLVHGDVVVHQPLSFNNFDLLFAAVSLILGHLKG